MFQKRDRAKVIGTRGLLVKLLVKLGADGQSGHEQPDQNEQAGNRRTGDFADPKDVWFRQHYDTYKTKLCRFAQDSIKGDGLPLKPPNRYERGEERA